MLGRLSSFFLFLADHFRHSLPFELQLLPPLQIVLPHLLQVLLKQDLPLLPVFGFFPLPENLENALLEEVGVRVADVDELERVLDSDFGAAGEVIHQKLYQVKKVPRLQPCFVKNAALIHEGKLVLVDLAVKILVDLPDPLVDLGLAVAEAEFGEDAHEVLFIDGKTSLANGYGRLLQMDSLSELLFYLTLSPHILRKVFRRRSASMFSIGISQTCYSRDFSWVFFWVEDRAARLLCFNREAMIVILLNYNSPINIVLLPQSYYDSPITIALSQQSQSRQVPNQQLPGNPPKGANSASLRGWISYNNKMNSFQNSSLSEPRIEDSILFEVNEQTLVDMNLTEHICRLEHMSRFLGDAINKNRANLYSLKEVVKNQISSLKNSSQALQTNIRDQTTQLKNIFEPAIGSQIKKINELKGEVGKINSEQLSTKKYVLNLQAAISHCQTEIGFRH